MFESMEVAAVREDLGSRERIVRAALAVLDETDDVQLKKEIARYLRRVDRLDDDAVSNVVAAIHEDVDLQEVDANMAHLTFILGLELDMLTKRTFALPVLKAIRLYGTRRQKEWANRKYRKAILL